MADKTATQNRDSSPPSSDETPRRNVLWSIAAIVVGAVATLPPLAAGMMVFLNPLLRKDDASNEDEGESESPGKWLRVTSIDSIPENGLPAQFPVLTDLVDAWNRSANQPIGAVYLRREADGVQAFSAVCPHAGCFVAYAPTSNQYECPCHNSAFALDGAKVDMGGKANPSPRPLDELETKTDGDEVWVKFVNYYPAKHEQVAKP